MFFICLDLPSQPKTREEFLMCELLYSCVNVRSEEKNLFWNTFNPIFFLSIDSSELNLNRSSACSQLSVKNKSVSRRDVQQSSNSFGSHYQYQPTRTYQVLCNESLSGRCYFEVQFVGKGCSIMFSYDQISGRQGVNFGSNDRSWKCDFPAANLCVRHNNQQTNICLVSKIGVFLDQVAGTVSFYNVSDKMTLLHRIQTTFSEPLYPGFSFQDWGNYSSVTICDLP